MILNYIFTKIDFMDKIYHIYNKENRCISSCLSENDFKAKWEELQEEAVEYEELNVDKKNIIESSY